MDQEAVQTRYCVSRNFVLREIAGEYMLIPMGEGSGNAIIMLNRSCAFLWKQLQTEKNMDELILAAKEQFDDLNGGMEADIKEFVEYRVKTGHIIKVV